MRPTLSLFTALILGLPVGPMPVAAEDGLSLRGEYTSNHHRGKKRLEATFTPSGDGHWDVVFRFDWDGRRTYVGTAEGSLSSGRLEGTATHESRRRTFSFRGEFEEGLFEGTHYEINRRGRESRIGTLVLRPRGVPRG